jgi:hypothetical protein
MIPSKFGLWCIIVQHVISVQVYIHCHWVHSFSISKSESSGIQACMIYSPCSLIAQALDHCGKYDQDSLHDLIGIWKQTLFVMGAHFLIVHEKYRECLDTFLSIIFRHWASFCESRCDKPHAQGILALWTWTWGHSNDFAMCEVWTFVTVSCGHSSHQDNFLIDASGILALLLYHHQLQQWHEHFL